MKNELISIVIPTHNRPEMLIRAIDSIVKQTYKNWEIIIVDDASTIDIKSIIEEHYKNKYKIYYYKNDKNVGACKSRNIGINKAKGTYIAGLDDDDEFCKSRLEVLIQIINDYSFATADYFIYSENRIKINKEKRGLINLKDQLFYNKATNNVLIEKEKLILIGGYDENLSSSQDYDLWLRVIKEFGPAIRAKTPLYIIHEEHEQRISTSPKKLSGHFKCYLKHKEIMCINMKIAHHIRLKRYRNAKIPFRYLFIKRPLRLFVDDIKYMLKYYYNLCLH